MLGRVFSIIILFLLGFKALAGTPDHLMWAAKRQDAIILGEVVTKNVSMQSEIKVLAVFPQTKIRNIADGQIIYLDKIASYEPLEVGGKYLMSLNKKTGDSFTASWAILKISDNSSDFRNARLLGKDHFNDQYMITTGGRFPYPSYDASLEFDPNFQKNSLSNDDIASLIKTTPTRELIERWINYPVQPALSAFNDLQHGFERISTKYQVLPELLKRPETAKMLLETLKERDLSVFQQALSDEEQEFFKNEQVALSLLIAQPSLSKYLSDNERRDLLAETNRRLQEIQTMQVLEQSMVKLSYKLLQERLQSF